MHSLSVILVCLLEVTIVSSIYMTREKEKRSHDSSSSSSDEDYSHKHDSHEHHRHTPRTQKSCPAEWATFDRPQGRWCVRIFYGNSITHDNAEAACGLYDARLTGLQNAEEKAKTAELSKQLLIQLSVPLSEVSVRLGGVRKPECPTSNVCAAKDTFMWTDKFTTGTDGFLFQPGDPNAAYINGWGYQSCIHQMIYAAGYEHGALDDVHCQLPLKLYACGKRP